MVRVGWATVVRARTLPVQGVDVSIVMHTCVVSDMAGLSLWLYWIVQCYVITVAVTALTVKLLLATRRTLAARAGLLRGNAYVARQRREQQSVTEAVLAVLLCFVCTWLLPNAFVTAAKLANFDGDPRRASAPASRITCLQASAASCRYARRYWACRRPPTRASTCTSTRGGTASSAATSGRRCAAAPR